jgi:hypothetical protein
MIFGIVDENGYISSVERRFASLEDAKGKVPEGYLSALVPLPDEAVAGAYWIDGVLSNRTATKIRKKRL